MAQGQRKSLLLSRQPRACQGNALCIGLWMIYVKTLVNRSTAVDECCCGKVDNPVRHRVLPGRRPSAIHRAIRSIHRRAREAPLSLAMGGREAVTAWP